MLLIAQPRVSGGQARKAQPDFAEREVLAAAKPHDGATGQSHHPWTFDAADDLYIHFHVRAHEVVLSNGAMRPNASTPAITFALERSGGK